MSIIERVVFTLQITTTSQVTEFNDFVLQLRLAYLPLDNPNFERKSLAAYLRREDPFSGENLFIKTQCCLETNKDEYTKEIIVDLNKLKWARMNDSMLPSHSLQDLISDGEYQLYFQVIDNKYGRHYKFEESKVVRSNVINVSVAGKVIKVY
jgi:hypothetical protein